MRRITVLAWVVAAVGGLAGTAIAHTSPPVAATAAAPTIKVVSTQLGRIIETGAGFTVYEFTADGRDKDVCATRSGCTGTWPPLTVKSRPIAGPGVTAHLLGTIKLAHGGTQVTYAGHPLYRYAPDSRGSTDYVGVREFGGAWYALASSGQAVR